MVRERVDKSKGKEKAAERQRRTPSERERARLQAVCDAVVRQEQGEGVSIRHTTPPPRRSARTRGTRGVSSTPAGRSGSRKRPREESGSQQQEEEEQEEEEQPQAQGVIRLLALEFYKPSKIKKMRFVPVEEWFPETGDQGIDPRFWTIRQESLFRSAIRKGVKKSQHNTLRFDYLDIAAGGADVRRHFDAFPGLTHLLTQVDRFVPEWVQVFYATVWIPTDRSFIQFMFDGHAYRVYRAEMLHALGLEESDTRLHQLVYGDAPPPHRPLTGGTFPTDDQIRPLFRPPFPPGSQRLPDMLIPEARAIHFALKRSLLPRVGNAEAITSIQQWLLLLILTHQQFDILDMILAEIEDVISEGLSRQQPYAHIISFLLARAILPPQFWEQYQQSTHTFSNYIPSAPDDRRRGPRAMAQAQQQVRPGGP